MSASLSSKLPKSGTLITLLTDCAVTSRYAGAPEGSSHYVLYVGKWVLLVNAHTEACVHVRPWELESSHYTVMGRA